MRLQALSAGETLHALPVVAELAAIPAYLPFQFGVRLLSVHSLAEILVNRRVSHRCTTSTCCPTSLRQIPSGVDLHRAPKDACFHRLSKAVDESYAGAVPERLS